MIFAKGDAPTRAARNRRDLPRRSVWPFVLLGVAVMAGLGGVGWAVFSGRLPGVAKPNFLTKLMSSASPKESLRNLTPAGESPPAKTRTKRKERLVEPAQVKNQSQVVNSPGATTVDGLRAENANIRQQLLEMAPTGFYVVINTAGNRVVLHNGDKTDAEMVASCGSGNVLEDPKGGRRWTFDTPRGVFYC